MADKVVPGPVDSKASFKEAVCIHTHKVFDSCRDKTASRTCGYTPPSLLRHT